MGGGYYYSNRAILGYPSLDSIQEFKVERNSYNAQFGGDGSIVTIVTKSGTNTFHGSAYYFARNDLLNAKDLFFLTLGAKKHLAWPLQYQRFGMCVAKQKNALVAVSSVNPVAAMEEFSKIEAPATKLFPTKEPSRRMIAPMLRITFSKIIGISAKEMEIR